MAGTEGGAKKKRKRKTRSERNQVLHCPTNLKKNHKSICTRSDNMPRVLRSFSADKKNAASALLCGERSHGSITQGRLTRGLTLFKFSKSSDCVSRGPGPLTTCVKKTVEESLKQVLNPPTIQDSVSSSFPTKIDNINETQASVIASKVRKDSQTSNFAFKKSDKIVQTTAQESSSVIKSLDNSKEYQIINTSDSSCISGASDNELEEVLPVNAIACKIMQSLKPKFNKLHCKRDLRFELIDSLQKQLRKSSRTVAISQDLPLISSLSEGSRHQQEPTPAMKQSKQPPSTSSIPTYSSPIQQPKDCFVLTAAKYHRPTVEPLTRGTRSQEKSPQYKMSSNPFCDQETASVDRSLPYGIVVTDTLNSHTSKNPFPSIIRYSNTFNTIDPATSFIQANVDCGVNDAQDSIPIKINFQAKEEDSDTDHDSGLSIVQYNAFMASARSLKAQLKIQEQEKHFAMPFHQQDVIPLPTQSIPKSNLACLTRKTRASHFHHHHHSHLGAHKVRRPCLVAADVNSSRSSKDTLELTRHQFKKALDSTFPSTRRNNASLLHQDENWPDDVNLLPESLIQKDDKELFVHKNVHHGKQPFEFETLLFHQSDLQDQARSFLSALNQDVTETRSGPPNTDCQPLPSLYCPRNPFPVPSGFEI